MLRLKQCEVGGVHFVGLVGFIMKPDASSVTGLSHYLYYYALLLILTNIFKENIDDVTCERNVTRILH